MPVVLSKPEVRVPPPPRCTLPNSKRRPKLLIVSFDGTWAGGFWTSRTTVIPTLFTIISDDEDTFEVPIEGVGSHGLTTNWILGGITGHGTLSNVFRALKSLARHYRPGDRIILSGYSRGAWAARYLALFIWLIGGLPKYGDEWLYSRLYKVCSNKSIWKEGVASQLMKGYECYGDLQIDALCCFDTVGSLGIPMTGLATPLRLLRIWNKKHDFISNVAPNVLHAFHAVALNEPRAPFATTLMRGEVVHQVAFAGNHASMGWMDRKNTDKLICGPLAWMLQQLETFLGISFNEHELAKHFPLYNINPSLRKEAIPSWTQEEIKRTSSGLLAIMGKKDRKLGRITSVGSAIPDLEIHRSVRIRGHGQSLIDPAIAGYRPVSQDDGTYSWVRQSASWTWSALWRRNSDSGSEGQTPSRTSSSVSATPMADFINEARLGPLEARLLGMNP